MAKTKSQAKPLAKPEAKPNTNQRLRSAAITLLIIVAIGVVVIVLQVQGASAPALEPTEQRMTLEPQVVTNLTEMPNALPPSAEEVAKITDLKTQVEACPDYDDNRRSQMEQHIAWLLAPSTIPAQMIIALGSNPTGKLIYGMATYTSIQWKVDERPAESCLIAIGTTLNEMLVAAGEPPFEESPG